MRAKAREARLPISTFVRHAALAQPVQAPPSEISISAWQDMARVAGNLNQLAHAIAAGRAAGVTVQYGGGQPAYAPLADAVRMPMPDRFLTSQDYAATMLHELSHASGHQSRLNRLNLYARFGSEEYAREELRAELASALLGAQLGVPMASTMMESHASYLANWLTVLKRDKNEIFRAAADAQKIADYLGQWAIGPTVQSEQHASHTAATESHQAESTVAAMMRR